MSEGYRTFEDTPESVLPGQLEYSFILDVKPALDSKFTFTDNFYSPIIPDISASLEHSTMFTLYLNTPYALASLQAKGGNSCIGVTKDGVCTPEPVLPSVLHEKGSRRAR